MSLSDHLGQPDPAAYLNGLPTNVQHQLARIARTAAGMSDEEKRTGRIIIGSLTATFATEGEDAVIAVAQMVSSCGVVLAYLDDLATVGGRV